MTPKYSIRAFDSDGELMASAAIRSLKAAKRIAQGFLDEYRMVDLYEFKGMRQGVAMYERIPL